MGQVDLLAGQSPTLVYINSTGHSGSTLLELLLIGNRQCYGIGEVTGLYPKRPLSAKKGLRVKRCNCQLLPLDCPIWQQVNDSMTAEYGIELDQLDLMSDNQAIFERHNLALIQTLHRIHGVAFIVDGSKSTVRLEKLLRCPSIQVRPVVLTRNPCANVFSHMRKGFGLLEASIDYVLQYRHTRRLLKECDHYIVRYEYLANESEQCLRDLMAWLGVSFESQQLNWSGKHYHRIGGNQAVRSSENDAIVEDQRWRMGLQWWQKFIIVLLTAFVYLPNNRLLNTIGGAAVTCLRRIR